MTPQKIGYVPPLLPDELLYSWLARLVAYNQLGSPRSYLDLLFGAKDVIPGIDLPTLLEPLQHRLSGFSPFRTPYEMIDAGTIYPYHRPFLPIDRHEAVEQILLRGGGQRLKTLLGRVANRFGANPPLQYCAACMMEDIACHGAPYWHRNHQLPGVSCCTKHGTDLVTHLFPSCLADRQCFRLAPGIPIRATSRPASPAQQLQFAVLSRDLLLANLPALNPQQRIAIYENAIRELGFSKRENHIDLAALLYAIRAHYADFSSFTHRARLLSTPAYPLRWLQDIFERPLTSSHPVCHVLLIGFLFKTIDRFQQAIGEARRYPVSSFNSSNRGSQTSSIKADCENNDLLMRDTSLSCRAVAQILHLSVTTVVQRRRILGLPIAERRKYLDKDHLAEINHALAEGLSPHLVAQNCRTSISTVYRVREQLSDAIRARKEFLIGLECKKRRTHWKQVIHSVVHAGVRQARARAPATYAWLYRHDRSWLRQSCRPLRSPVLRSTRVDWAERDRALCQQLNQLITSLNNTESRPRISKSLMCRHLGEALIRTNIDRLPLLQALMGSLYESPQAFQLFRIDKAIEILRTQGLPMAMWRIQRLAGVKKITQPLLVYANTKSATAA